ncbi:hypothetical protein [Flagellimonas okinawensis]|uniref:Lipoprotein n=1 Tax=Flagellimonas okinawensis TaxID=3031324 RepID=A0ABT5XP71_9FLAO|nr:hypothetical protein [[Muricauda] okinawensis]MDF0707686.1 hypothetical protein [[Muricauda] okinawensis]
MKIQILFCTVLLLVLTSCQGQEKKENEMAKDGENKAMARPKGSWKVDREFDENGNLIRYDSIYSWSSDSLNDLSGLDRDSLLSNFESKFYSHFSQFRDQGFGDLFEPDSLFSKRFFNDGFFESDFGEDFIELDNIRKRMMERQRKFLEKYRSDLGVEEKDSV